MFVIVIYIYGKGGYDLGDGQFMKVTDRGVKYPVTPGHEIVGTVEDLGSDVFWNFQRR